MTTHTQSAFIGGFDGTEPTLFTIVRSDNGSVYYIASTSGNGEMLVVHGASVPLTAYQPLVTHVGAMS